MRSASRSLATSSALATRRPPRRARDTSRRRAPATRRRSSWRRPRGGSSGPTRPSRRPSWFGGPVARGSQRSGRERLVRRAFVLDSALDHRALAAELALPVVLVHTCPPPASAGRARWARRASRRWRSSCRASSPARRRWRPAAPASAPRSRRVRPRSRRRRSARRRARAPRSAHRRARRPPPRPGRATRGARRSAPPCPPPSPARSRWPTG